MEPSFEAAFERLEQILEKMNAGKIALDESLKLFEEADKLTKICNNRLLAAEQKIETLIKNRSGELVLDESQKPKKEPFARPAPQPVAKADDEVPF